MAGDKRDKKEKREKKDKRAKKHRRDSSSDGDSDSDYDRKRRSSGLGTGFGQAQPLDQMLDNAARGSAGPSGFGTRHSSALGRPPAPYAPAPLVGDLGSSVQPVDMSQLPPPPRQEGHLHGRGSRGGNRGDYRADYRGGRPDAVRPTNPAPLNDSAPAVPTIVAGQMPTISFPTDGGPVKIGGLDGGMTITIGGPAAAQPAMAEPSTDTNLTNDVAKGGLTKEPAPPREDLLEPVTDKSRPPPKPFQCLNIYMSVSDPLPAP